MRLREALDAQQRTLNDAAPEAGAGAGAAADGARHCVHRFYGNIINPLLEGRIGSSVAASG